MVKFIFIHLQIFYLIKNGSFNFKKYKISELKDEQKNNFGWFQNANGLNYDYNIMSLKMIF